MRGINILCPLSSQEKKKKSTAAPAERDLYRFNDSLFCSLCLPLDSPSCCLTCAPPPTCIYLYVLMSLCLCVLCARGSVLDVNDETPTFSPRVYNVSLKESVPRDHTVARLSCSDNDAGLNAELSYFITGQRSQCVVGRGWVFCVSVGVSVVR